MGDEHGELLPELRHLVASKSGHPPAWKPNAAYETLVEPDPQLALVVGACPISRQEIGKKLWDYIKSNNLQDPTNRWMINADDALAGLLGGGRRRVTAIELMRYALRHVK